MPMPTPFHERTRELCTSLFYKDWGGYYTVRSYDTCPEREYFAIRHGAGLIDVSPLFKYEVTGRDAGAFLARVMVRDVRSLKAGRVTYLCWCDDDGKVIDDGTVSRLGENEYRVTAAEPTYSWLMRQARGYDVSIVDISQQLGALAVQGPTSREVLRQCADTDMDTLKFFTVRQARIDGATVWISRTGYTGDLGYEVWVGRDDALRVYDAILHAGRAHGAHPAGLDAMDIARVEAGFIMNGVDYWSANHCLIESRKSSPFELGLGWAVNLEGERFIGRDALAQEKQKGSPFSFVGLIANWDEYEALFAGYGLPPQVPVGTQRDPIPIYNDAKEQVGRATSRVWSPILKQYLAIGQVYTPYAEPGTLLQLEVTAEWERRTVTAVVHKPPFFDPQRKRKP